MSASMNKATLTFFGSTGGSMNAALVLALQNGNTCTALARTPQKLIDMLLAAGVSQGTIDGKLHIEQGDVADLEAVKRAISNNGGPDMILSGIGPNPFSKSPDLSVCQKATRNILAGLRELQLAKKPAMAIISTTGITNGSRDVPIMLVPLYHALLKKPHVDKKAMETMITEEVGKSDSVISGYTFVRPTLLFDSKPVGMAKLRVGTEGQPALGYSISRKDVGQWIYEELINGDEKKWRNQAASLTS